MCVIARVRARAMGFLSGVRLGGPKPAQAFHERSQTIAQAIGQRHFARLI